MKKHSILTVICAFVSAISIVSLSACGTSGNTSTDSSTGGSPTVSTPSEKPEDSKSSEDSEELEKSEEIVLTVEAPMGEVFPYLDCVKNYLQAGAVAKVGDYFQSVKSQYAPVQVNWTFNGEGARKFVIEYATKADFSDALSIEVSTTKRSVELYNLYKATKYYVRVTAVDSKGEVLQSGQGELQTTSLGPRFMYIDDVRNVRDLGGYETSFGKTIVQGIAYRGGTLTIPPNSGYVNTISEEGKKYMSEVMGIKAEIDFRNAKEAGITLEQGSVIPGATLTYITINTYKDTFNYVKECRTLFSMLADKNNYPVYMHCTGGADRTGTVVFLLHALLGVSEMECIQGYELTSFSNYGLRDTQGNYQEHFQGFMEKLNSFEGNNIQEKTETWVRSLGITQEQIDNIKAIFFGEIEIGA